MKPLLAIAVSKAASYIGTMEAIRQNPDLKIKFAAARDSLALLETSETIDVISVVAVLDQLPIKELRGDRSSIIINTSMILVVDLGVSIPLDNVEGLQAWVRGVREGMDLAIGAFPADTTAAATAK